mgnify:CR=1 FL=1
MMYLSRLRLAARAQQSESFWNLERNPYGLHQETWRLFGAGPDAQRDFLFRIECGTEGGMTMYGLSPRPVTDKEGLWETQSKPFDPKLQAGSELSFSLRVNPTRQREGKRHDVVMDAKFAQRLGTSELRESEDLVQAELDAWLRCRGEPNGFELLGMQAAGYRSRAFQQGRKIRTIQITTCDLDGLLVVRDPERFLSMVFRGLGPAKAFGCGLFLLRRS